MSKLHLFTKKETRKVLYGYFSPLYSRLNSLTNLVNVIKIKSLTTNLHKIGYLTFTKIPNNISTVTN